MDDRIADLERVVADLSRSLAEMRHRVAALEGRATSAEPAVAPASDDGASYAGGIEAPAILSLVGRTCLVLGGGYLLRALTDGGTLPRPLGAALGLAYAVLWFVAAWRTLGRRRGASGASHATAAVLVAFPLLWESTVRFNLLSQAWAAVAMAGVTLVGLAVASHRRAQVVAWIVSGGGAFAAIAFIAASASAAPGAAGVETGPPIAQSAVPMALYVALLGVTTASLAYRLSWTALRWPVAGVADVLAVVLLVNADGAWHQERPAAVILVLLVTLAAYLATFVARAASAPIRRGRACPAPGDVPARDVPSIGAFECAQTAAVLLVCLAGAIHLMPAAGWSPLGLGLGCLVCGAAIDLGAFLVVGCEHGSRLDFRFCALLGLVLLVVGTTLAVAPPVAAVAWAAAGVAAAWGVRRAGSVTLAMHAAVFIAAASLASGLLAHATEGLTAAADRSWNPIGIPALLVLAAVALCAAAPLSAHRESWGRGSRVPKIGTIVLLLWIAGGTACAAVAPWVAGQPGTAAADAALLATLRTAILAAAVLALAWLGRRLFLEGRWLMHVVLVAGGVKLLVEDFPNGRPATLFLTLAVYGAALILGPRLRDRAPSRMNPHAPAPVQRV